MKIASKKMFYFPKKGRHNTVLCNTLIHKAFEKKVFVGGDDPKCIKNCKKPVSSHFQALHCFILFFFCILITTFYRSRIQKSIYRYEIELNYDIKGLVV